MWDFLRWCLHLESRFELLIRAFAALHLPLAKFAHFSSVFKRRHTMRSWKLTASRTFRDSVSHSFKFSQRTPLLRFFGSDVFSYSSASLFERHFPARPHLESPPRSLAVGVIRELAPRLPSNFLNPPGLSHCFRLGRHRQERTSSTFQFLQLNCSLHHGRFPVSEGQSRGCVVTAGHSAHQSNQFDCSNAHLHATSLALFCEVRRDILFLPRQDGKGHEEKVYVGSERR